MNTTNNITTLSEPQPTQRIFLRPKQLAARWGWHCESVRRLTRQGRIESKIIFGRRLIPLEAILKIEEEGTLARLK